MLTLLHIIRGCCGRWPWRDHCVAKVLADALDRSALYIDGMTDRLTALADSYLDHIRIAVEAGDRGAPFRDFFDNWNAFQSKADHHRSRDDRPRWFNNPSAARRLKMLEALDYRSAGAAAIMAYAGSKPVEYAERHKARDRSVRLIVDHAIPVSVMAGMFFDKAVEGTSPLDRETVKNVLQRWYRLGLISHAENAALDAAGLNARMPVDWDGVDVFARYQATGISRA